jgi:hypothetical protein
MQKPTCNWSGLAQQAGIERISDAQDFGQSAIIIAQSRTRSCPSPAFLEQVLLFLLFTGNISNEVILTRRNPRFSLASRTQNS